MKKTVFSNKMIHLSSQVRHRSVGEEGVLVHLENGRVIVVNAVGLFIIQQLTTPMAYRTLAEKIAGEFAVSVSQAGHDLEQYLASLHEEQIIETTQTTN